MLKRIYRITLREFAIYRQNPIYIICMVIFPVALIFFFTSLMMKGTPADMPVGIVDLDNTTTTRSMIRMLDAFQTSKVVAYYDNVNEARKAVQRNEIYAFLYLPEGTTEKMMSNKQPQISYYFSNTSLVAGSLLFRDMKTITSLSSAKVGMTKLAAIGKTKEEIMAFLQPITIDLHMAKNPYANYNYYLSTTILPGVILLLVFLLTPYSIGTEVKFGRSREWIHLSGNNIYVAMFGKMLPQTLLWLIVIYGYEFYIYSILHFPHPGGALPVLLLGLLAVLSCQGFGIFIYGVVPSVRMSMSMGALWGIVSASICGATYPVFSMNPMAEALATLFPLRHYYMFYQIAIFNGYPLHYAMPYLLALIVFSALPILTLWNTKKSMLVDNYLP